MGITSQWLWQGAEPRQASALFAYEKAQLQKVPSVLLSSPPRLTSPVSTHLTCRRAALTVPVTPSLAQCGLTPNITGNFPTFPPLLPHNPHV